jgi:cyanophycinase-like exopeptidase
VFVETGMGEFVVRRYYEGALVLGVSAGAVQLGLYGLMENGAATAGLVETFGLVPFVIDAHDEGREWGRLRRAVRLVGGDAKGIGIPTGGGVIYYPDRRVEAVRRPLHQLSSEGGEVGEVLLPPKQGEVK